MRPLTALVAAAALTASVAPAAACSIAVTLGGVMTMSGDYQRLDSTESGGRGALVAILNLTLGAVTITVQPPTISAYPAQFAVGSAVASVAYSGGGVLNGVTRAYTTSQTSFQVPALVSVAAVLTVHNRIVNPAGFQSGQYETKTVLTCS